MNSKDYHKILIWLPVFFVFVLLSHNVHAQDPPICTVTNQICVINTLISTAEKIDNAAWRDQVYREVVKTMAIGGNFESAYALLDKIETPDTKAMSIRGIGMAVADHSFAPPEYSAIFQSLRAKAEGIEHPPSYAIALTYIAMSQAFAGDDKGSWKTASDVENQALRNKAFGETAEIQAEFGNYESAKKSIEFIDTASFRNKAYHTISKILSNEGKFEDSYDAALSIDNPYKKSLAIQYILDVQASKNNIQDAP